MENKREGKGRGEERKRGGKEERRVTTILVAIVFVMQHSHSALAIS